MKGIKLIIAVLMVAAVLKVSAQARFEKVRSVKGIQATVQVLNETMTVMVVDSQPSQRYTTADLPEELHKDGLHLIIDGDVGAIPPNVRMIGTPFRVTSIRVSAAEQKKYKLSKRRWCLKKAS